MAKDRRSRSRKPSGNKSGSPSRSTSTDTALRVPLPASSPTSATAAGDSSDHEETPQADSIAETGISSQALENPQEEDASQASEVPVLADDGPLDSPQIEPALGGIVEDSANDTPVEYSQSPTNTDQSISPGLHRPSYNLDAELQGANLDNSDEDTQAEGGHQPTSASAAQTDNSNEGTIGEDLQEETRKRLVAEERVRRLESEKMAQRQRYEDNAKAAKKKHDRAMEKANKELEAQKLKLEEAFNENERKVEDFNMDLGILQYNKNIEELANLGAIGGTAKSSAGDGAKGDVSNLTKQAEYENEEYLQAINEEIRRPTGEPRTIPRGDLRPGSARFLLTEYEYLLDKNRPLYNAMRATADYADGEGALPTAEDRQRFDGFRQIVALMNDFLNVNINRPNDCLNESRRDWELAAESDKW